MKKLITLWSFVLLASCINMGSDDEFNLTPKFKTTWNIYESLERNNDGSIIYHALPWGGMVGLFKEQNLPVDWSGYESLCVEFAEPTPVPTHVLVSDQLRVWGKKGITSLKCYFDGQNVTSIGEVALQAADTSTIVVKRIYLTPGNTVWDSTPIWEGHCVFGNWENGFEVKPEKFMAAQEGDKIEFIFSTDKKRTDITYWQFKTIYDGTDMTLEGNSNELNDWGCATVGRETTSYRIVLTANDVAKLRKYGLFVNGYYNIVTQCNLMRKDVVTYSDEKTY